MTAYLISDVSMRDAGAFQTYRTRAAASIAAYGDALSRNLILVEGMGDAA